ncbi:MAG: DEAD/DEAH box helicase [Nanoarchaeota archaeon]
MPEKFLVNITPRKYQTEIFEKCKNKNCLVVLPTGIGKTLVALMLTIDRMQKFPMEKVLFLAPTRPLAEQHLNYFKKHLTELFGQMDLFTGKIPAKDRKKIWEKSDIVFSTPQCIGNDLKNKLYDLENVSLLIEDEAHRCVKNYSYTYVAKKYVEQAKDKRILGMTASPGTDKATIKKICQNLLIEEVELRTRESSDVKEYLQELEIKVIKIPFPDKFKEIRDLLSIIYRKNVEDLKHRNLIFGPINKVTLIECQKKIMMSLTAGSKNPNLFHGASSCAQAVKIQHAIELLETQTIHSFSNYINDLKEQADENKSKAVKKLVSSVEFIQSYSLINQIKKENLEHPKLLELKSIVEDRIENNKKGKIIVFCQYRDSIVKISKELNSIPSVNAKVFVGQAKKTNKGEKTTGLSQKEQQEIIRDFSSGEFNVLCATSIGEEGLDIPEVSTVIFYEPVPSAIRRIQRAGRTARLMPGELIMLVTKDTRDEAFYWASISKEKKMHKAIDDIKNDLNTGKLNTINTLNSNVNEDIKQKRLF